MNEYGDKVTKYRYGAGKLVLYLLLMQISYFLLGCSIFEIRKQSRLIGNLGFIQGKVIGATSQKGQILVLLFKKENAGYRLTNKMLADAQGEYKLWATPGTYYVAAYVDSDNDGMLQQDEPWNYYGKPTGIRLTECQTATLETLVIHDNPPFLDPSFKLDKKMLPVYTNTGKVVELNDPSFNVDNYALGMWRPVDFLKEVGGGLFFLQKYEEGKIPIIFVHGIKGGPTDFSEMIRRIDRTRYQPWVIYYPSGVPLDLVSEFFDSVIVSMQNRYQFDKFALVGHSMGGVVVRSMAKKYVEHYPERSGSLAFVMTVNSPLGGMPSAEYGVKSPLLVQSWRDIVPESPFLKTINNWPWPASISYYLIFSYSKGNSDGVVQLQQQIPLKQQLDATRVVGIHNDHSGTLQAPPFLQVFTEILRKEADKNSLPASLKGGGRFSSPVMVYR